MAEKKPLPEEANRVILVSNIRWTALSSVVAIIFMTLSVGLKFAVLPIIYVAMFIALYNIVLTFLARNNPEICNFREFVYIQFLFDLLAVTALVHFTGGLESPFVILYLLFPTIVAIFYGSSFAILMAGHAVVLFAGINRLESLGFIPHYMIAIPPIILYRDNRFLFLYVVSFFFICLALIYSVSYLAEMFRQKQREIEEVSAEKMDFMNNVAHELRSPLTSIKEYVSLFTEGLLGEVPANQREIMAVIDRQTRRMVTMISDLLDIARIESGKAKFEKKEVNFSQVIDNAATELVPQ
ncbi:MAG TPA: histidine kinase dimerization/phospho-acceptor domain-containing protein, partial [Candidatus Omnitrophota bacterium]|nr:histidine kinase dimerization/phospho-acceptor domain-containing protein [Candidatus Omnitrophota bacterium]